MYVPKKVTILTLRVLLNHIPMRVNLENINTYHPSIICQIWEDVYHAFISFEMMSYIVSGVMW